MFNYDFEMYLEHVECLNCHNVGVKGNSGDTYICPVCHNEGSIYEDRFADRLADRFADEQFLMNKECPECGAKGFLEQMDRAGEYKCGNCGYEGNIQDDIDNQNYFWDEALCGYDEDEKGEVFDKES